MLRLASSISNTNIPSVNSTTKASSTYAAPLVSSRWQQGEWDVVSPYNKYCRHNGHYAYVGCSIIATAQVMAANKYYDSAFPYSQMGIAGSLYWWESQQPAKCEKTSQFIGFLFDHLKVTCNRNQTGSSMATIRSFLNQMDGYYNVRYSTQNSFTNNVVTTAKGMIQGGKPVIVSAAGRTISDKHCWVLDGYYSSNWFCWSADNAVYDYEYDTQKAMSQLPQSEINQDYNWYVMMLTYDHR